MQGHKGVFAGESIGFELFLLKQKVEARAWFTKKCELHSRDPACEV